ncbi:hypothetical protein BVX99_01360, partial [bacterium F16]
DIILELYDTSGSLLESSNPATLTTAGITRTLSAGTYYVHVKPTGAGNASGVGSPYDSSGSTRQGYTIYGSLGRYTLSGLAALPSVSLTESGGTTEVTEGGATDTYTVVLDSQPNATVTVAITSDAEVSVSPSSLNFTTSDWDTPQTVTVTALNDSVAEPLKTVTLSHTATSSDSKYHGLSIPGVTVTVTDDDNTKPDVTITGPATVTLIPGASSPWTPAELTLQAWYDAADASSITQSGGTVSQLNDKSGSGNHASNGTIATQPGTGARNIGGRNAIEFGQGDTKRFLGMSTAVDFVDRCIIGVFAVDSTAAPGHFMGSPDGLNKQIGYSVDGWRVAAVGNNWLAGATGNVITSTTCDNAAHIVSYEGAGTLRFFIDGTQDATTEARENTDVYSLQTLGMYNPSSTSAFFDGLMGELLILESTPSMEDRQKLEGYLAHKWGLAGNLPADHPYKDATPTISGNAVDATLNGTVTDDQSCTYKWSVVQPAPGVVTFSTDTAEDTLATFTVAGTYTIRLTATDAFGLSGQNEFIITVNDTTANAAPVANAGADQTVEDTGGDGSEAILLDGSGSSDADGTISSYVWTEGGTQIGAGVTANVILPVGIHTITLTVTDGDGAVAADSLTITVNAAPDVTITAPATVTLIQGASRPWTPAEITTTGWYDASDTTTITESGGSVSTWHDKSGNVNHASQPTSANQPKTGTRSRNGLNVIDFGSSGATALELTSQINVTDTFIFMVGRVDTLADFNMILANAGSDPNTQVRIKQSTGSLSLAGVTNPWLNDATGNVASSTGISAHTDYVLGYDCGNPAQFYIDGTVDPKTIVRESSTAFRVSAIGARNPGTSWTNPLDGYIGELVILDAPTTEDRQKLEGYLAHKWGLAGNLPADHPYKDATPTISGNAVDATLNGTVTDDQSCTYKWSVVQPAPGVVTFSTDTAEDTLATFTVAGTYTIRLTATDAFGLSGQNEFIITVNDTTANAAPVANAGADQTVEDTGGDGSEAILLDGSGSSDADGTISSYVWTEGGTQIGAGVTANVILPVGIHTITLTVTDDDGAVAADSLTITVNATPPLVQTPYNGTPAVIPGTIMSVHYDNGGEGVAYHDTTAGYEGSTNFRNDDVDGGETVIGWFENGEWLEYTVDVTAAGRYDITLKVASGGGIGSLHIEFDGINKTGAIATPNTGSGGTFVTVTVPDVTLSAGQQVMRVYKDSGSLNLSDMVFTSLTTPVNNAPVIDSQPWADDNPVILPNTTTVNVVASDVDGDTLTYTWSNVTGPGSVTFIPNGTTLSDISTVSFSETGTYELEVTVTDTIDPVSATVTINVEAVSPTGSTVPLIDPTGRLAWFALDTDTGDADGNLSMTLSGATIGSDAKFGAGALVATATGQFASLADNASFNTGGPWSSRTTGVWFKVNTVSGRQVAFEEGGSARGFNVYVDNGTLYVGGWDKNNDGTDVDTWSGTWHNLGAVTAGQWVHVALVLDAAADPTHLTATAFRAYRNGALAASGNGMQMAVHSDDAGVGAVSGSTRFHDGATSGTAAFAGSVDDLVVWNRVLSAPEIAVLAETTLANSAPVADDASASTTENIPLAIALSASDVDGDPLTYQVSDPSNGSLSGTAPNLTYTPSLDFVGTDSFTFNVNDGQADSNVATVNIVVNEMTASSVGLAHGVASNVGDTWQTITLPRTYTSMVVVATPLYTNASSPTVVRIRNATGNSFEVKLQNPGGAAIVTPASVHYIAIEEGTYTVAQHGVNMEAVKVTSTITDAKNGWNGEAQTYSNSYTSPVIIGQVMTANDPVWSVFWCRGSSQSESPSSTTWFTGKTVCEDSNTTRADETIGYIVMEAGSAMVEGETLMAGIGTDIIVGMDDGPKTYALTGLNSVSAAVASIPGLDGVDGGWPVLHATPTNTTLTLVVDEDQIGDSERNHTTENVAFLIVE